MRSALAAGLAVLALFAVSVAIPFLTGERDYPASIPQPSPLESTAVVKLAPGSEACLANAVVEEHSEEARFRVGTIRRRGAPLAVDIGGPGYRQRLRVRGGYPDNALLSIPLEPPKRPTPVRICIRNQGETRMDLYGASDQTRGRSRTSVDGRAVRANVVIGFWERRPRSIVERLPETAERMTVFRPGVIGEWLVWPLALLFVLGTPAATLWALGRCLRD